MKVPPEDFERATEATEILASIERDRKFGPAIAVGYAAASAFLLAIIGSSFPTAIGVGLVISAVWQARTDVLQEHRRNRLLSIYDRWPEVRETVLEWKSSSANAN